MATGPGGGLDQAPLRGTQPAGAVARMARTRPSWATGGPGLARGLVKRGIRRRRLAGGVRGLLHTPLQGLDLLLELVDTRLSSLRMRLHGRRRQCPFHGSKRQSPEGRVGFTWRRRCHHAWGSAQRGRSEVLIGNPTSKVNTIMTSHAVENPLWSRTLLEADTERRQRLVRRSSLREEVLLAWLSFLLAIHESGEFGDGFQNLRPNLLQTLQGRRT
jgi:hypothetical protein